MLKRVHFPSSPLPYLLVAPQIVVTLVFFIWPAAQALKQSFFIEDAFGLGSEFVWFENFTDLFASDGYRDAFLRTLWFSGAVAALSMGLALALAAFTQRAARGAGFYQTMLIWPYAVAAVLAGALWMFLFDPTLGIVAYCLEFMGVNWNFRLNGGQAMAVIVIAAAWKQIAYNFLFYLAAMKSIPNSVMEAAAMDGAGPVRRFMTITLPLISPTTFFLLVINLVYAFFETFGIVHAVTQGGPARATEILVYKVFNDGFVGLDLGGSAAQSVVLMALVIAITAFQFGFLEKRVQY